MPRAKGDNAVVTEVACGCVHPQIVRALEAKVTNGFGRSRGVREAQQPVGSPPADAIRVRDCAMATPRQRPALAVFARASTSCCRTSARRELHRNLRCSDARA